MCFRNSRVSCFQKTSQRSCIVYQPHADIPDSLCFPKCPYPSTRIAFQVPGCCSPSESPNFLIASTHTKCSSSGFLCKKRQNSPLICQTKLSTNVDFYFNFQFIPPASLPERLCLSIPDLFFLWDILSFLTT